MALLDCGNKGMIFACYQRFLKGPAMNVNGANNTQQMQQMQMRKMDGSGGGQGQGGMRDIMQSLSNEDRTTLKEQMSSMSMEDRQSMISQMKQVDSTSMTSEEYAQSLLDILNQDQETATTSASSSAAYNFSVYA